MIVLAHVAGLPVEELLPTVAGAGSMLLLARGWVALRFRRSAHVLRLLDGGPLADARVPLRVPGADRGRDDHARDPGEDEQQR